MWYIFGDHIVDTQRRELRVAGVPVKMQRKVYQLLLYLIEHRDRLVTKEELLDHVWPEAYVEESAVSRCISAIRKSVGDRRRSQHVIQTVHGQGYRFVASVAQQQPVSMSPFETVPAAPSPSLPLQQVLGAERKLVTVLCGAMAPALHRINGLTLDGQHALVTALNTMLREAIAPYGGTLEPMLNDRFSIMFGAPQAQEDHARRALLAALAVQRLWPSLTATHPLPSDTALRLGMGLHTGEVAVDNTSGGMGRRLTLVGEVPSVAAHLAQQATPGAILLSAATVQLISTGVVLAALPPLSVADRAAPLDVYRVQADTATSVPPLPHWERHRSRFVGRQSESAALLAGWERARHGQGQIIGIIGDAGMGKSRLLEEFRQALVGHPKIYLAGRCESYGQNTPYLPLKAIVEQACGLHEADSVAARGAKISFRLQELGLGVENWMPWLRHLLGEMDLVDNMAALSPQTRRQRTFDALHQLLLASCRQRPLIIEVENAHWIDATSEAYLTALTERLSGVSILLLFTYRPGYQPPWGATSNAMQLPLAPLLASDGERIVHGILQHGRTADAMIERLVAQAQGNPLFLEELAQTVREEGGQFQGLPDTIQTVLAARIDRLPPDAKRLLQAGAVVGAEVQEGLLQAVVSLPEDAFHRSLRQLQASEMLYETRLVPEVAYTFKHIMIREAAYQSLLASTRQQYHQRIAQALEARFPDRAVTQPELLAHHYSEAGLTEQAVTYWQQAGQRAVERSASVEAISHLRKGLEVLQTLPKTPERIEHEIVLLIALGAPLMVIYGYGSPEAEHVFARARMLCQTVEGSPHLFPALWGYNRVCTQRAEYKVAQEVGKQLLASAERLQDPARLLEAHFALGIPSLWTGELEAAVFHMQAGRRLYDPQQHRSLMLRSGHDHKVGCLTVEARALWFLGYPDRALTRIYESLARAQELSHPFSQARALVFVTTLHQYRREVQHVRDRVEELLAIARTQDFALWVVIGTVMRGWARSMQGEAAGIAEIRQALELKRAIGSKMGQSYFPALLAEACAQMGQPAEGLTILNGARAFADRTGECFYEAELHRLNGQLLLQMSPDCQREAEADFQKALSIARDQHAKSLELRAATSLARLWQQQDKRQQAQALLAPVYSWFTEGFDTLDLKEAKTLLDTLT